MEERDVTIPMEAVFDIRRDVSALLDLFRDEEDERARARAARWAETDPKMRELRERIEYHRARLAAAEAHQEQKRDSA
jgi:hypothetical protein